MSQSLSIIIPVLCEGDAINETIADLRSQNLTPRDEIIVVDGHPDGTTLRFISCKKVIKLHAKAGRASQMNAGAKIANGKTLLFLHADTRLPEGARQRIYRALKPSNVVGGAFDLGIASTKPAYRLIEAVVFIRTRLTRIPYGDQAIFLDRCFFQDIGGFREIPLMEDVEIMRRIKRMNKMIAVIPEPVRTSPRRWEKEGIVFCTLRNWMLATAYLLGMKAKKLNRFYR